MEMAEKWRKREEKCLNTFVPEERWSIGSLFGTYATRPSDYATIWRFSFSFVPPTDDVQAPNENEIGISEVCCALLLVLSSSPVACRVRLLNFFTYKLAEVYLLSFHLSLFVALANNKDYFIFNVAFVFFYVECARWLKVKPAPCEEREMSTTEQQQTA